MFTLLESTAILQKEKTYHPKKEPIGMKIAVCDDDRGFVKAMRRMLCTYAETFHYAFQTEAFYSAETLLASPTAFDLVFLDYRLGSMSGLDAARALRERRGARSCLSPHTRILCWTRSPSAPSVFF